MDTNLLSPESLEETAQTESPEEQSTVTAEKEVVETTSPQNTEHDDQNEIRRKAKYAKIESDLAEKTKRLQELENSPAIFMSEVDRMLKDPSYKTVKEQEWIENPSTYNTFRAKHQEVYGVDLGSLDQYLKSQSNSGYDPRIEKVQEKQIEEKIYQTVASMTAEQKLESELFSKFPDADPFKADTPEEKEQRLNFLSLAKIWAGDRLKYKLNTNYQDAVIDAYQALNAPSLVKKAQQVGEAVGRFAKANEGVGVGVNVSSGKSMPTKSYRMNESEKAHYQKMIAKGKSKEAEIFARLCDEEKK